MNRCAQCDRTGTWFRGGRWLCVVHHRFDTMRTCARARNRYVPTRDELERLADAIINDAMHCPSCSVLMQWTGNRSDTHTISLQHDACGHIRFLCKKCNMRHAAWPGDRFYEHPIDWKYCPKCDSGLPPSEFYRTSSGRLKSYCKGCKHQIAKREWASKRVSA